MVSLNDGWESRSVSEINLVLPKLFLVDVLITATERQTRTLSFFPEAFVSIQAHRGPAPGAQSPLFLYRWRVTARCLTGNSLIPGMGPWLLALEAELQTLWVSEELP